MRLSPQRRAILKQLEGFRSTAYTPVPGDKLTIGYGFTEGVQAGDTMTLAEADKRLVYELREYEQGVWDACTLKPNANEFDAMVLLAYNVGVAGFRRSTVLRAHNRGDKQAAARAFALWNQSGGKVYAGLTRRRAMESAIYLEPVVVDTPTSLMAAQLPMPQNVTDERPMTASGINRASVVAGGTAAVAAVSETLQQVQGVKYGIEGLGPWLVPVLLVAVVVLCGYIVWQRTAQRREGWA